MSEKYKVPKEMLAAILFREMTCLDVITDLLDIPRARLGDDNVSVGYLQLSIKTIQNAQEQMGYPVQNRDEILMKAYSGDSIELVAQVLTYIASVRKVEILNTNNSKTIFSGYNSGSDYSDQVWEYMMIFKTFYDNGGY